MAFLVHPQISPLPLSPRDTLDTKWGTGCGFTLFRPNPSVVGMNCSCPLLLTYDGMRLRAWPHSRNRGAPLPSSALGAMLSSDESVTIYFDETKPQIIKSWDKSFTDSIMTFAY